MEFALLDCDIYIMIQGSTIFAHGCVLLGVGYIILQETHHLCSGISKKVPIFSRLAKIDISIYLDFSLDVGGGRDLEVRSLPIPKEATEAGNRIRTRQ